MLTPNLPTIEDREGHRVPDEMLGVVDAHVQCFDMNGPEMQPIYSVCRQHGKPLVMHVGREPKSEAYRCDPYRLCRIDKLERVIVDFPDLKVCVPHLGFDETEGYRRLIERHDNLWLDTTMALARYFPGQQPVNLHRFRPERVMYGSDFPNIPYAWDRELKCIRDAGLTAVEREWELGGSAAEFFGLEGPWGQAPSA